MANGVTFKLEGTREIVEALSALDPKEMNKLYRSANVRAAVIVRSEILARTPRYQGIREKAHPGRTFGPLFKTIKSGAVGRAKNPTLVVAGANSDGFYARFLERGTKERQLRYRIRKADNQRLNRGITYPRGRVDASKHRFIEPAIDASVPRVITYCSVQYGEQIGKTLGRWVKKQQKQ